jgi:hypothetical protein
MQTIKTSELIGAALDWAVAKCEYNNRRYNYGFPCFNAKTQRVYESGELQKIGVSFAASTDWKQGGPIIEREKIKIYALHESPDLWAAQLSNANWKSETVFCHHGQRPLTAAMRCYVASKLGDTVEVPEELTI